MARGGWKIGDELGRVGVPGAGQWLEALAPIKNDFFERSGASWIGGGCLLDLYQIPRISGMVVVLEIRRLWG
jgi:hypothetical protein